MAAAGISLPQGRAGVVARRSRLNHVGHQRGDYCLRAVVTQLQAMMRRQGDVVGCYGGEEFIAILPGADKAHAHDLAQRVLQAIRGLDIKHPTSPCGCITLSIGVASMKATSMHLRGRVDELLGYADRALYAAKATGRNAAYTYPPNL